jgi:hypothetical protein
MQCWDSESDGLLPVTVQVPPQVEAAGGGLGAQGAAGRLLRGLSWVPLTAWINMP